jgi:hypothetical protein
MTDMFVTLKPARVAEAVMVALLSDERYKFRSTARLATAAGITESEVRRVAAAICARQDHDRTGLWGLVARVGS